MRRALPALLLVLGGLGACRQAPSAGPAPPIATDLRDVPADRWIGRWVGVEGLALDIQLRGAAGRYRLTLATMAGTAFYAGEAHGAGIRFTRDGRPAMIHHVEGAETGLKWLNGKHDCLTIRPGEGFCRD